LLRGQALDWRLVTTSVVRGKLFQRLTQMCLYRGSRENRLRGPNDDVERTSNNAYQTVLGTQPQPI
jgi:hypothetical protein